MPTPFSFRNGHSKLGNVYYLNMKTICILTEKQLRSYVLTENRWLFLNTQSNYMGQIVVTCSANKTSHL